MSRDNVVNANRRRTQPLDVRFWSKVNKEGPTQPHMSTPCWEWTAGICNGYGSFGMSSGTERAHRVAWTLTHGDVPTGKQVLHACDHRKCVNPAHLRIGTNADNVQDKMDRGRHPRGEAHRVNVGESNGSARLTREDVARIREDRRMHKDVARDYGVSRSLVGMIRQGKVWSQEPNPMLTPSTRHRWVAVERAHNKMGNHATCARCKAERAPTHAGLRYRYPDGSINNAAGTCQEVA